MKRLTPGTRSSLKSFAQRVDTAAGHLNVVLVVIALGLATLDFTFFVTEKVVDSLPPVTHIAVDAPPPATPSQAAQK